MLEIQTKVGKKKPGWGKLFVGPEAQGHSQGFQLSLPHIPVNAIWLCLLFEKSRLNKGKLPKNGILRSVGLCKECSKNLCVTY